jgi:two-component system response regulator MprA
LTAIDTPSRTQVLVVEDEPGIAGFVRRGLIFEGFAVDVATTGKEALARMRDGAPDVVVLDIMLPEIDGLEVCRRIRAAEEAEDKQAVPILMLTARDAVTDRVSGLESGADDYLVKPFAFEELLARVRALLRRAKASHPTQNHEELSYDDLHLDMSSRLAFRGEREIHLTTREFDLLALFLRHPNQVLTRTLIMDRVWGEDFFGDSNVLEVFIGNLRRLLEADNEPRLIQTIRGAGYVLRRTE